MRSILTILFFIVLFPGCKKDSSTEPVVNTVTSGSAAIDTRRLPTGFSFARGDTLSTPNTANILPDIEFSLKTLHDPRPLGVVFVALRPYLKPTFNFKHFFSTLDSARAYFQGIKEVEDTAFTYETLFETTPYQIYTVKTFDNKFAKILITKNGPSADTSYAACSFEWTYQSNGRRSF